MSDLSQRLARFSSALQGHDMESASTFFADNADFRAGGDIVRGREKIVVAGREALSQRGTGNVTDIKQGSGQTAIVNGVFEVSFGKGWFTEIWDNKDGGEYVIRSSRIRVGDSSASFEALSEVTPHTVSGDIPGDIEAKETSALQTKFKQFRSTFNDGNVGGMLGLFTADASATPVFSFIQGRSQIMHGQEALGAKAENMTAGAFQNIETADESPTQGAMFVGGEPKVIRFMSPTFAVVDGTAHISGIPAAHGFAPKEMKGIYTDLWTKDSGDWQISSTLAWF